MSLGRYIAKRLLLMIPTLLGILLLSFAIIQFVPGGPVEQLAQELKGAAAGEANSGGSGLYSARGGFWRRTDAPSRAQIDGLGPEIGDPGPWTLDPGPWTLDPGPWTGGRWPRKGVAMP